MGHLRLPPPPCVTPLQHCIERFLLPILLLGTVLLQTRGSEEVRGQGSGWQSKQAESGQPLRRWRGQQGWGLGAGQGNRFKEAKSKTSRHRPQTVRVTHGVSKDKHSCTGQEFLWLVQSLLCPRDKIPPETLRDVTDGKGFCGLPMDLLRQELAGFGLVRQFNR